MSICATILSGNSEALVGDAIRSVRDWVDRVLLIDTGIFDSTLRIASDLVGERLIVERFSWINDFAAARNFALDAAAQHGFRWALTVDTDERLEFPQVGSFAALRLHLDSDLRVRAWLVNYRDGSYAKERFIRVDDRLATTSVVNALPPRQLLWSGRTHECLTGIWGGERATMAGVFVWEIGKSREQFRAKLERDLAVLLEETRDKPGEARWWYYLGQTYEGLGRPRDAMAAFQRCAAIRQGWAEQAAWACYRAANCALQLQEREDALELCAMGLARQPESPELAWLAGFICHEMGRFTQAVTWSQIAISLGHFEGRECGRQRISFRHLPGWYEGPYDVLRYAYRQLGQHNLAMECEAKFEAAKTKRERLATPAPIAKPSKAASSEPVPKRSSLELRGAIPLKPLVHQQLQGVARVAVLGLYSSGSTATATVLHRLGVKLGHRFFADYYEPLWLSEQLRKWWHEPDLKEVVPREHRVRIFSNWMKELQRDGHFCVGAKHPLLTLCGPDLIEAWGPETKFIWTSRPLDESIRSLKRRGWWPGREEALQTQLWTAAKSFFESQPHLRIEFENLLREPQREVNRIIEFLELHPSPSDLDSAVSSIWRPVPAGPGDKRVLFDLGCHYGEGLRKLQDVVPLDEKWEIHAYEPNPYCHTEDSLAAIGLPVTLHKSAVWTHEGRIEFASQDRRYASEPQPIGAANLPQDACLDGLGSSISEVHSQVPGLTMRTTVPCVEFAKLLAERPEDEYVVVKMDIEGAEFPVLRQLAERGLLRKIKLLFIEWHERLVPGETSNTRGQLERQLREAGVKVLSWE
jgi:FkbM family methyltransferase